MDIPTVINICRKIAVIFVAMNFFVLSPIAHFVFSKKFDPKFQSKVLPRWLPTLYGTVWLVRASLYCVLITFGTKLKGEQYRKNLENYNFRGDCNIFEIIFAAICTYTLLIACIIVIITMWFK